MLLQSGTGFPLNNNFTMKEERELSLVGFHLFFLLLFWFVLFGVSWWLGWLGVGLVWVWFVCFGLVWFGWFSSLASFWFVCFALASSYKSAQQ